MCGIQYTIHNMLVSGRDNLMRIPSDISENSKVAGFICDDMAKDWIGVRVYLSDLLSPYVLFGLHQIARC